MDMMCVFFVDDLEWRKTQQYLVYYYARCRMALHGVLLAVLHKQVSWGGAGEGGRGEEGGE